MHNKLKYNSNEIYHLKTTDKCGRSLHVFLKTNPIKKPQLERFLNLGTDDDITNYGEIIATCHGRFPTIDVRKKMREVYNFDC